MKEGVQLVGMEITECHNPAIAIVEAGRRSRDECFIQEAFQSKRPESRGWCNEEGVSGNGAGRYSTQTLTLSAVHP